MKFLDQGFQMLEHEQDTHRHTDRHATERITTQHSRVVTMVSILPHSS